MQEKVRTETMTKAERQAGILADHQRALYRGDTMLWRVYGSYSRDKALAFDKCRYIMFKLNGYDGAIVSHNGWRFSYGFYYDTVDEETGELLTQRFMLITDAYGSFYDFLVKEYV